MDQLLPTRIPTRERRLYSVNQTQTMFHSRLASSCSRRTPRHRAQVCNTIPRSKSKLEAPRQRHKSARQRYSIEPLAIIKAHDYLRCGFKISLLDHSGVEGRTGPEALDTSADDQMANRIQNPDLIQPRRREAVGGGTQRLDHRLSQKSSPFPDQVRRSVLSSACGSMGWP